MEEKEKHMADLKDKLSDRIAIVELYKWQYGELPLTLRKGEKQKNVNVPLALDKMALGLYDRYKRPEISTIVAVLHFCAYLIRKKSHGKAKVLFEIFYAISGVIVFSFLTWSFVGDQPRLMLWVGYIGIVYALANILRWCIWNA